MADKSKWRIYLPSMKIQNGAQIQDVRQNVFIFLTFIKIV
jgi:hypothetical protein